MPSYVTSPGEAIKQRFSIGLTGGQNEPPIAPFTLGAGGFQQSPIPPPVSQDEIQRQFAPLIQEVQGEEAPTPREAPSPLNPWMVFASALAANMGSSLTKNPLFAQQFAQNMEQDQKRRQAIEDENYANELLFSKEKRTRLFAIRGQALETALKQAIDANDMERAAKIAQNLETHRASIEKQLLPAKQAAEEHGIRVKGEEDRKLERLKILLENTKSTAGKPLTMDQFQDNVRNAIALKEDQLPVTQEGWNILGIQTTFGQKKIKKQDVLDRIYAEGALSGDQSVSVAAKRNLILSISQRLGVDPAKAFAFANGNTKALTKDEQAKFDAELAKYGL
jgi:hypothetical protein